MKTALRMLLWSCVIGMGLVAIFMVVGGLDHSGTDAAGRGIAQAIGILLGIVAAAGVGAMLLARRWRGWLIVAAVIVVLPFALVGILSIAKMFDEAHNQQYRADLQSGREDFREQPELLAVAEAISNNDDSAIRAAVKNVPNLQAAGRDGKTLLYFAVDQALERPQLVKAVETLLSLGADPNYNNGQMASFAMWRASNGEVRLLRTMLEAGGNPNAPDFRGTPIIFGLWDMTFFEADSRAKLRLLLDRGADINSTQPETSPQFPGYTLLLFRTRMGPFEPAAYTDAIDLLERGADPNRVAQDGMTLVKMLTAHRAEFADRKGEPSKEFGALWERLQALGVISKEAGSRQE